MPTPHARTTPLDRTTYPGHHPARARTGRSGPHIRITRGSGTGPTTLAAFDAALAAAGAADFNLVRLSSVIPPGALVETEPAAGQIEGGHGDLLYCVYASGHAVTPGSEAWAGIAWALHHDGSGAGLFVEHTTRSREELDSALGATLGAMMHRRGDYSEAGRLVVSARCESEPVAAVVLASYRALAWSELGGADLVGLGAGVSL